MARLPIENVTVVGAGGNGSIFLTHLCRIHQAWVKLGGQPFGIKLYDPDDVSEANLARQVFCEADIGQPKALVLAQRMSAFFGIEVEAEIKPFTSRGYPSGRLADVVVGCVDTIKARKQIEKSCTDGEWSRRQWGETTKESVTGAYWLDLGNASNVGQVVLGGHGLPNLFGVLPQMRAMRDRNTLPSCSMAESLDRQDLFINSTLATLAGHLLWRLMRQGGLNHHGYFVNLNTGRVSPVEIK